MLDVFLGTPLELACAVALFVPRRSWGQARFVISILVAAVLCAVPSCVILWGMGVTEVSSASLATLAGGTSPMVILYSTCYFVFCSALMFCAVRWGAGLDPLESLVITVLGYLLQHLTYDLYRALVSMPTVALVASVDGVSRALHLVFFIACYALVWVAFARSLVIDHERVRSKLGWVMACVTSLFFAIIANLAVAQILVDTHARIACQLYDAAVSALLLALLVLVSHDDRLQNSLDLMHAQDERRMHHLELLKEDFASINSVVHELKEAVRLASAVDEAHDGSSIVPAISAERADELDRAMRSFDAMAHTGNASLDVLLSEQSLRCQGLGVSLVAMVDGSALSFMEVADLYALFGNVLELAVGLAEKVLDPALRAVTVDVRTQGAVVRIEVDGFCEGTPAFEQSLGLTAATHQAQRYGGDLHAEAQDGAFTISGFVPVPADK